MVYQGLYWGPPMQGCKAGRDSIGLIQPLYRDIITNNGEI